MSTMHELKRRQRMRERLHRIEVIAIVNLVLTGFALGFFGAYAVDSKAERTETQEPAQVEARETAPAETEAATEPLNAEIEPPVVEIETAVEEEPAAPAPRYDITPEEFDTVARVVHSEAQGEGFDGMALVAQCVLNTAEATGQRPDAVVLIPGQYAAPAAEASEEVKEAVKAVFIDGYQVTAEPIRWFYAPARCYSAWHENSLEFVLEHGGHRFFKTRDAA